MNLENLTKKSLVAAIALGAASFAAAATAGTLGATSTGTAEIDVVIADRVQVTGLDDINLGTFGGAGDMTGATAFCVYRNGTGLYDMTVSSANESGTTFRATDGSNFLSYVVRFDDDADASDGAAIGSSAQETAIAGNGTSLNCGSSDNASLHVTFAEADLLSADTGSYNDTITVLVEPN